MVSKSKQLSQRNKWQNRLRYLLVLVTGTGSLYAGYVYAVGTDVGTMATTITKSFYGIAQLITAGAYIAGMGFALSAILKFKQHKDNPTQIPIGTPIAMLFIAAALIFLPTIFGAANATIFGGSGSAGGVYGVTG